MFLTSIALFFNLLFKNKKPAWRFGVCAFMFLFSAPSLAKDTISLFPLQHYDQTITHYLKQTDTNNEKPLLSKEMQKKRLEIFYDHYFGRYSPWNENFVYQLLYQSSADELKTTEKDLLDYFANQGKSEHAIGYAENFRPHNKNWLAHIVKQINLAQFDGHRYQLQNRAIAIDNLAVRALPTEDVHFYSYQFAGQGYPFDNLQMSALWAGTPLYIVGESQDHAWLLVLTPDCMGWVNSKGVARAANNFINTWTLAAHEKLAAITQTQTSIVDENDHFLFSSYVGAVFPVVSAAEANSGLTLLVPGVDTNGFALIKHARLSSHQASVMPMVMTEQHVATIMQTLIGRPYGWGGAYFYNDCSAELKSLFTPFGIWLPRHSADQLSAGKMVDMSWGRDSRRLAYLRENGKPLLTIVYVGGHVLLYVGNYPQSAASDAQVAMTYQNVWALKPRPGIRRAVIGQSVLFPMLLQYPEDTTLTSFANEKYFKVVYLNELPATHSLLKDVADIRNFMYPEILLSYGENFLKRSLQ